MKYYCKCCDYTAKQKSHYDKHLATKKHFKNYELYKKKQNSNKICNLNERKIIKCLHCEKMFTTTQSMERHMKISCKVLMKKNTDVIMFDQNQTINELKETVNYLKHEMEELKNNPKTINNINNGTINNNVILNTFDNTDTSFLTDKDIRYCLNQFHKCIPTLAGKVHCNIDHPENMNMVVTNLKGKYISKYAGGDHWTIHDRYEEIQRLIIRLSGCLDDWQKDLPEDEKYDRLRSTCEGILNGTDDEDISKMIHEEISLILYNNRHNCVLNSKVKVENIENE